MGCVESKEASESAPISKPTTKDATREYPVVGNSSIMKKKSHGTSITPVQDNLRWDVDFKTADRICNYNRHFAEHSGYWQGKRKFIQEIEECRKANKTMIFYDSNTGKPLYEAPKGRSWHDFLSESKSHGWPSFRDPEVIWDDARCMKNGEAVSLAGTHLGHNLRDKKGNRYCINLVSIAGRPSNGRQSDEQ